jgi:hypothetical protein
MTLAVLTLDLAQRHLVVVENGQEKVWPVDTLPFSRNWHKLPTSCHQKLLGFLQFPVNDPTNMSTQTDQESNN